MTDQPRTTESILDSGRLDRRTLLKGAVAGLVGTAATGTASAQENGITLEAGDRPVKYRIVVSGTIQKGDEAGTHDNVEDGVAVGEMRKYDDVDDWVDNYVFTGRILGFDVLKGSLDRVWVNDERVDLKNLGKPDEPKGTVLEDFEDGAWPDDWTRETRGYGITEQSLVGRFSIEANGSLGYPDVHKPIVDAPRGHTYTVRTVPGSSEAKPTLLTNCQQLNVMDDSYAAWLRTGRDELRLQVRSDGRGTTLEAVPTSQPLRAGREYVIALDVGSHWVRARAFASDGLIAATERHGDTTHSGGTPGLYTGGTEREVDGTLYDQYVRWPLGSV